MFGIGMPEMILILALALIVIGPKKLPDLAKSMGRAFREFKQATNEIKDSMGIDNELQEVKNSLNDINTGIKESIDLAPASEVKDTDTSAAGDGDDPIDEKPAPEKPEGQLDRLRGAFDKMNDEQKALFSKDNPAEPDTEKPFNPPDTPAKEEKDT